MDDTEKTLSGSSFQVLVVAVNVFDISCCVYCAILMVFFLLYY